MYDDSLFVLNNFVLILLNRSPRNDGNPIDVKRDDIINIGNSEGKIFFINRVELNIIMLLIFDDFLNIRVININIVDIINKDFKFFFI